MGKIGDAVLISAAGPFEAGQDKNEDDTSSLFRAQEMD